MKVSLDGVLASSHRGSDLPRLRQVFEQSNETRASPDIALLSADNAADGVSLLKSEAVSRAANSGALLVDISSVPWGASAVARRVARDLRLQLVDAVECRPWGTQEKAPAAWFVGATPQQFDRVRPVLMQLGLDPVHVGPAGGGYGLRLALVALNATIVSALSEVIPLAAVEGVLADDFYRMAQVSRGNSGALREVMAGVMAGDFTTGRSVASVLDDLELAHDLAGQYPIPLSVIASALNKFRCAKAMFGVQANIASLFRATERLAGRTPLETSQSGRPLPQSAPSKSRCGFVGLGLMGRPMAHNLAKAANGVVVYDIAPQARERMAGVPGIEVAPSLEALAKHCDVVFLSLPDHLAVEAVALGPSGLLAGMAPGSILIDASTSLPALTRRLAGVARERGISVVDAPVSGGPEGAEAASLSLMVGAEESDLARVLPLLNHIGSNIFWAGPPASGHSMKVTHTALNMTTFAAFCEAAMLAVTTGVTPRDVCRWITTLCPAGILESRMPRVLSGDFEPGASINIMHKDVYLASLVASDHKFPFTTCESARMTFQSARGRGLGPADIAAVVTVIEDTMRTSLRQ